MSEIKHDAEFELLFNKALEALDPKLYETKYAPMRSRELIPSIDGGSGLNAAHTIYTYEMLDGAGQARAVSSRATDLPQADVNIKQFSQRIQQYGNAFSYDRSEVRALAEGRGMDIALARLNHARKAMEQKMDEVIALGDADCGLEGSLNHSSVSAANAATGGWTTATDSDLIIADIQEAIDGISSATLEVERPDLCILPATALRVLQAKRIDNTSTSLLDYVRNTFDGVRFESWHRCESAGAGSTKRMVVMKQDPEVLAAIVPQEFTRLEPIYKGYFWEVPTEARCGGVVVRYPKAVLYRDGI